MIEVSESLVLHIADVQRSRPVLDAGAIAAEAALWSEFEDAASIIRLGGPPEVVLPCLVDAFDVLDRLRRLYERDHPPPRGSKMHSAASESAGAI